MVSAGQSFHDVRQENESVLLRRIGPQRAEADDGERQKAVANMLNSGRRAGNKDDNVVNISKGFAAAMRGGS